MRLCLALLLHGAATPGIAAQTTNRGVQLFESHERAAAKAEFSAAVTLDPGNVAQKAGKP